MSERQTNDNGELVNPTYPENLGRLTVLEALAEETKAYSPDALGRTTYQGSVDFDD